MFTHKTVPCWTGDGMPGKSSLGGERVMSAALSYSSGESATPLLGDTIGGNFDATVGAFGSREALVDRAAGRRWTYTELAADVDALALGLLELGIGTGDRVGIWAPNCAEWTLTQYAIATIGAILSGGKGTAAGKIEALREAGIAVAETPASIGDTLIKILKH